MSKQNPASDAEEFDPFAEAPWMDGATESALRSIIPHYMQGSSAVLYGRWWQLERWLRTLVYVELKALHGRSWVDEVKAANGRLAQDAAYTHMSGPDNDNPLAYLDYSQLIQIVDNNWAQLGYALLEKGSWDGRQVDLKRIRHRIGHMRSPHSDDINRLEQTLRDLERGAFIALASYNERWVPDSETNNDPVTRGWIDGEHEVAQRLLVHAFDNYETNLNLRTSKRPWNKGQVEDLAGAQGYLWHADFFLRSRFVDVPALWRDVKDTFVESLLLHLEIRSPRQISFTFSAADDAHQVSDAIGRAFDWVLVNSSLRDRNENQDYTTWTRRYRQMDYRIVCADPWTTVDETTVPINIFGAGGGVDRAPRW
ncbi:Swt1 family HEPN domain-containing protein [Kribbella sp. NPDC002412]